jgi:DNA-binding NtrC family response regulator
VPGKNRKLVSNNPYVSSRQLRITPDGDSLRIENIGKRALLDGNGVERSVLTLRSGDVCEVKGQFVFLVSQRPAVLPSCRSLSAKSLGNFGGPDTQGLVGESPVAYRVRDTLSFVAARQAHVLLLGPSGAGKEIAARAIHRLSPRAKQSLVARNAATFPESLIDAELFGNQENYPQAGMAARPGLVGEAHGGTLFLDEIGELPEAMQTRLLRFLDVGGEYQRLGDSKRRHADVRMIAATNRPVTALKNDLAARFKLRVTMPGLNERREDIVLIAYHLLARAAREDSEVGERFLDPRTGIPRVSPELARRLLSHHYTTHVRELDALLWCALATSGDDELCITPAVLAELTERDPSAPASDVGKRALELDRATVQRALVEADWVHEKAWRALGLTNRHVLKRLVRKFGLRRPGSE